MKELNLLFPTIPNLSGFMWEKSWNNRFEKCWSNPGKNKGKIFIMEILRHLVVEYRRTRYVFPLNRTCAFQPDGFRPRLNCLTSWLNWFFNLNQFEKQTFYRFNDSYCMIHTIWVIISITSCCRNALHIMWSLRHRYVKRKMTHITVEQYVMIYEGIWGHRYDS